MVYFRGLLNLIIINTSDSLYKNRDYTLYKNVKMDNMLYK